MSRGPGRWQRLLLDLLEGNLEPLVIKWAIEAEAGRSISPSEYSAVNRAAWTLAEKNMCKVWHGWISKELRIPSGQWPRTMMLLIGRIDIEGFPFIVPDNPLGKTSFAGPGSDEEKARQEKSRRRLRQY